MQALAEEAMAGAAADHGLILRSAAEGEDEAAVAEDILAMKDMAAAVVADLAGGPELLVDGPGAHEAAWRDWASLRRMRWSKAALTITACGR